jgi:Ca2+-binding RTX toxin-like protein
MKAGRWASVLAAIAVVSLDTPVDPAGSPPRCFGQLATIVGTSGDDRLRGTSGADVIVGGKGVDLIFGMGGDDRICGGFGRKIVQDPDVGEVAVGDSLLGGPGDDRVKGGPHVDGLQGDDYNSATGTTGAGSDVLIGGGGPDNIAAGHGDNVVRGGPGSDQLSAGVGNDVMYGGPGPEYELVSGHGDDRVLAGRGRDVLLPMQGDDLVDGGPGRDLLNLFWEGGRRGAMGSHRRTLKIDLSRGIARGMGNDRLRRIEDAWGGSGDDRIIGDPGPNFLGATDDQGESSSDHNFLEGRGGRDRFIASPGPDRILGGRGFDKVTFALNEDSAPGPRTGVIIDLERGAITSRAVDSIAGIEAVEGTGGDDLFIGDHRANLFLGEYGNDSARGGPGRDRLFGGALADSLRGNRGDDELDGGPGNNRNDGGPGLDRCVRPSSTEGASRCER